jgi:hypothetical protein
MAQDDIDGYAREHILATQPRGALPVQFRVANPLTNERIAAMLNIRGNPNVVHEDSLSTHGGLLTAEQRSQVGADLVAASLTAERNEEELKMDAQLHAAIAAYRGAGNQAPVKPQPIQAFLRPIFVEGTIVQKISPGLVFEPLAIRSTVPVGTSEIQWARDAHSFYNDPLLNMPTPVDEGSDAPMALLTDPNKKWVSTGTYKLAMEFTDRAMQNSAFSMGIVTRALQGQAYAMRYQWNRIFGNVLANEFSTAVNASKEADDRVLELVVTDAWDTAGGDPLSDLFAGQLQMKTNDESYSRPTTVWLPPAEYDLLYQFLVNQDHTWALTPIGDTGDMRIRIRGMDVMEVPPNSGIPAGKGLMMALGDDTPALLEVWDEVDTRFTRTGSVHVRRTVDRNLNVRFEMSRTLACVNRWPKGTLVYHGLV